MYIKTKEEIKIILEAGKRMGDVLEQLAAMARPGMSTWEIDQAESE